MAFKFNSNTPTSINFNSQQVNTLKYNGVTVWTRNIEVYLIQNGVSLYTPETFVRKASSDEMSNNYVFDVYNNGTSVSLRNYVSNKDFFGCIKFPNKVSCNSQTFYADIILNAGTDGSGGLAFNLGIFNDSNELISNIWMTHVGNNYNDESVTNNYSGVCSCTLPSSGNYYIGVALYCTGVSGSVDFDVTIRNLYFK